MMCYKDKLWCERSDCLLSERCPDFFSSAVREAAEKWWEGCEGDPPICVSAGKPPCFKPKSKAAPNGAKMKKG